VDNALITKIDSSNHVNLQFPVEMSHAPTLIPGSSNPSLHLISAAELSAFQSQNQLGSTQHLDNSSFTTVATSSANGLVQYNSNGKELTFITVGQFHAQPQSSSFSSLQQNNILPAINQRYDRHGHAGKLSVVTPVLQLPSTVLSSESMHLNTPPSTKPVMPNEEKCSYSEEKQSLTARYNKYLSYQAGRVQR
jgi:hypothetical protein